jgi:hypothetical protein
MPFEVYLQKKLFQSVDMACTGFTITPETALGYEMEVVSQSEGKLRNYQRLN